MAVATFFVESMWPAGAQANAERQKPAAMREEKQRAIQRISFCAL
ncbi:hypothetical protein CPTD_00253 [Corynebacterium pseudotuberculosis]|nr:hypothetical protein CPTA_01274 [Corynebacterium pseudotuberculosis]AIG08314.1 hypothetical protein CPTB_00258 [Corynebacterium pseudotuberculosis]AIG11554.1 hypothetical protein CPTC_01266 [Corynebacterium pseudotuberculosis]KEX88515.1 hypothetical protein CPTD_00253 [Corynebacterium pseudotuberculosis]